MEKSVMLSRRWAIDGLCETIAVCAQREDWVGGEVSIIEETRFAFELMTIDFTNEYKFEDTDHMVVAACFYAAMCGITIEDLLYK